MVQLYSDSTAGVVTLVGNSVVFNNTKIRTNCNNNITTPTNVVTLSSPGYYKVEFDAVLANNTAASAEVGIQMFENGVADEASLSNGTSAGATDFIPVSFSALVHVRPSCCANNNTKLLTFRVIGADVLITHVNVVVTPVD